MRHIVLVGLMGSGKSTVGQLVADGLGWPMRDSDAEIEALTGRTVREIDEADGPEAMHALELRVLLAALADPDPSVICAAASVVDEPAGLEALRDPTLLVAWLHVPVPILAERFARQGHRPWFGDDPAAFLADQAAERDPRFRSLRPLELDGGSTSPEDMATTIVAEVRRRDAP